MYLLHGKKWSTLIGWFWVWILQYGPLPWKQSVSYVFSLPKIFKWSETQKVLNKRNLKQYNYSKRNLVLHLKRYHSRFADGRRRLRTFTKRRSVRSLKETMLYNKQLTNGGSKTQVTFHRYIYTHIDFLKFIQPSLLKINVISYETSS